MGTDVHVRSGRVRVAAATIRSAQAGPARCRTALTTFVDSRVTRWSAAAVALAFAAWVVAAGVWGPQTQANALLGAFYVLLWVGLVALSLALRTGVAGDLADAHGVSAAAAHRPGAARPAAAVLPESWGYRPAAVGLFAFVWMELASPNSASLPWVKTWLLVYAVVMLVGAWLCGQRWFARADPFGVYSMAVSRLSPFRRNPDDRQDRHRQPVRPSAVAAGAAGRRRGAGGAARLDRVRQLLVVADLAQLRRRARPRYSRCAGDVVVVGAAHRRAAGLHLRWWRLTFSLAARATGGVDREQRRALPGQMAHSLIPIVVGYIFAHYLSYLVERGQQARVRPGRPLRQGLESARAGAPARGLRAVACTRRCWPWSR